MGKDKKESGTTELVIRIRPLNGKDELTIQDVDDALTARQVDGKRRFTVSEVEGGSIEKEVLAVMVREAQKSMWESLSEIVLRNVKAYGDEWQKVKDMVEPMLQGKFATCEVCGEHALSGAFADGTKFICPHCGSVLWWVFRKDEKHPTGGRYILSLQRP